MATANDLVEAQRFHHVSEAHLLKSYLDAHDIWSYVSGDVISSVHPHLGVVQGVQLLVKRGDLEQAKLIIKAYDDEHRAPESESEESLDEKTYKNFALQMKRARGITALGLLFPFVIFQALAMRYLTSAWSYAPSANYRYMIVGLFVVNILMFWPLALLFMSVSSR